MGTEKNSDDIGKTDATPLERCSKNFKPWILALVVMVIFTLGWAIYEAQQRGGGVGKLFTEHFWERKGKVGEKTALNAALPGSAQSLQTSYHGIIEDTRPAVISIDAVIKSQNTDPGDPSANYTRIGSGVIIDPRGYALSSLHVVEGASSLKATVYTQAGALEYPLKIVKADKTSDLVLLRVQGDVPFAHASLGDSNSVRTGDVVISIGSPFGFEQSVTSGIISSRNRTVNVGGMVYENLLQTDSSINKGSSGGPLINVKGDVIGINTAIYSTSGTFVGISFAVPINRSQELLGGVIDFQNEIPPIAKGQLAAWSKTGKQIGNSYRLADGQMLTPPHNYRGTCTECHPQFLTQGITPNKTAPAQGPSQVWGQNRYFGPGLGRAQGPNQQGWGQRRNPGPWCPVAGPNGISLGMTVSDVDSVIANQNNMMRPGGVFILSVNPGMSADAAGLKRGDVVIRIDGRKIQDSASFEKFLETKSGSSVDLVILRFGVRRTVKVSLAQGGAAQGMAGTATKQPTSFTWLGADIQALPPEKAGVSVVEVEGVLAAAGVKAGDIITGVNNSKITDMNSFIDLTTKVKIKKGFLLDVMRSGNPLYIAVKG
jgi:S1-C subfamily serine protease